MSTIVTENNNLEQNIGTAIFNNNIVEIARLNMTIRNNGVVVSKNNVLKTFTMLNADICIPMR